MVELAGILFILPVLFAVSNACTFTIINHCPYTVWPGILAGAGSPELSSTGFRLESGTSNTIAVTSGWSGRVWGRTGCDFDGEGKGVCQTGDCGGSLECSGRGAQPPATLFEITFGDGDTDDFYDVSLVDGYNLPMIVEPRGGYGGCNSTGCTANLNTGCPKELQVLDVDVVACKSACGAFGLEQYCCSGSFANPTVCKPTDYSAFFKNACPTAYSYAFDDGTSTFTCKSFAYNITFCPIPDRSRRSNDLISSNPPSRTNNNNIVQAGNNVASSSERQSLSMIRLLFLTLMFTMSSKFVNL